MTREERAEAIRFFETMLELESSIKDANFRYSKLALEALQKEPCGDCISRQAMLDAIEELKKIHFDRVVVLNKVRDRVLELPPVTPQPKTGYWEWKPHPVLPYTGNWYCSECNLIGQSVYGYCPNCGCKMQEVEE